MPRLPVGAPPPFLTARWEHLLMLNYVVPRALLSPLVPPGTELDEWNGHCMASLVAFQFLGTRVRGVPLPWYGNFEEINLRFYVVRRPPTGDVRRGVVFVRELVKRRAVVAVARALYEEPYAHASTRYRLAVGASHTGRVEYGWTFGGASFAMEARFEGVPQAVAAGSETEFITEHYWGYTRRKDGSTSEYRVDHPRWRAWSVTSAAFTGPVPVVYGPEWADVLTAPPHSACLAEGSDVTVSTGSRL